MRKISYACPHCSTPLESELEDAGQRYPCPTCGRELLVPGIDKLNQLRAEEARRAEAKAREAAVKSAEERAKREFHSRVIKDREERESWEIREREARRIERAKTRAASSVSTPTFATSLVAVALLVTGLVYATMVSPLQAKVAGMESRLAETQRQLESLTDTVNYNARMANINNQFR